MIFDLVARAALNERYGLLSKPLRPFRDFAELECRGEDPRSLRALGFQTVRRTIRKVPHVPVRPLAPADAPSPVELPPPFSIERA